MTAAERKKRLAEITSNLNSVATEIESMKEDHEGMMEELSESAAEGTRGEQLQEIIDALEEAYVFATDCADKLSEIT